MNNPRLHFLVTKSWNKKIHYTYGRMNRSDISSSLTTALPSVETATSTSHQFYPRRRHEKILKYVFIGKLTLFPLIILLLTVGSASLLLYGDKSYFDGYFQSNEVYYGIAGILLSLVAITLLIFLLFFLVIKISFVFTPDMFVIQKRGILRSARLEFPLDPQRTSLHYFRTHFAEEQCWLQLVVRENNDYFLIFSSRGKGNQKERFLELFTSLQEELARYQARMYPPLLSSRALPSEIVSKQEFMLIGPFTARLRLLSEQRRTHDSETLSRARPLCIEDLRVISFDSFFHHFTRSKYLPRPSLHI
jgi:hypothetical protein